MPYHDRRECGIVGCSGFFRPGDRLIRIIIECGEHLRKQWGQLTAAICGAQSQSNNLQADIGTAAFVRHGKTVTGETDLATADQADAYRAGACHHDGPVRAAMSAETRRHPIADEDDRSKGMNDLVKGRFRPPATKAGEPNSGVHPREILSRQRSLCGCRFRGLHDGTPSLLEPDPRRRRSRTSFAENFAILVLDSGAAAGSAPIDAEIRGTFWSHRKLTRGSRSGSHKLLASDTDVADSAHDSVTVGRVVMDRAGASVSHTISAPHIFDGSDMRGPGSVSISQGRIESVIFGRTEARGSMLLPQGAILAPGFIDIQVNGGGGVLLNDQPTEAGVRRIIEAHRKQGTTGCLPTLITDRTEVIEGLASVAEACLKIPGVLGFHLEGPALNRSRKGIHPEKEIRVPDRRDLVAIKRFGGFGRSAMTLAPECVPASMIDELIGAGLRIAAGHSDATAAEIGKATDRGASCVTHLFNAMSQLNAREPGLVGAALVDDRLYAGIICDRIHVDRAGLRIAFRCKGRDRLMLVTDAMPLVGTNDRHFMLQGKQITLHENRLVGPDGTLAGAHLTMIEAVRNAVSLLEISLVDALIMSSRTPAAFLGLESELGRIAPGYRADLVAFNPSFQIVGTWIGGVGSIREASEASHRG